MKPLLVRLPEPLAKKLAEYKRLTGIPYQFVIVKALEEYLAQRKPK